MSIVALIPVEIRELKIHVCGFREIIFQSVRENLTISNCLELTSINWSHGRSDYVEEVTFECCPKLELVAIPVEIGELKIHECGFRGIIFQSVAKNLTISNCVELTSINWSDGGFGFVRKVTFECCPKLELVAIPVEIRELKIHECGFRGIIFQSVAKNLTISNCLELTSINWSHGGFNSIKEVTFECCPKLELVTIPVGTLKLVIHYCGFREIILQSVAENLTISNCVELTSINWSDGGFDFVREVTFECCPKLELVAIPVGTLRLKIHDCGFREIIFQSVFENLTISNCLELTSINWSNWALNYVKEVTFDCCPKLEFVAVPAKTLKLKIHDCSRLYLSKRYVYQSDTTIKKLNLGNKEIHLSDSKIPLPENQFELFFTKEAVGLSCEHIKLNLALLVRLEIWWCEKVISVTGLDNLSNLKHLSISYCPELCNWNDKALPLSLDFLKLDCCDKLSSLPMLSVQNHLNTLNVLVIKKCPRLAVLEGFHGLMKLTFVELLHCMNISIFPATESLQFRPNIFIGDCPLLRGWCQRNNITYYEV